MERRGAAGRGMSPGPARLPGDPKDKEARYVEAAINGIRSPACTCPTAIRARAPSSTTSWLVRAADATRRDCWPAATRCILAGDCNVVHDDRHLLAGHWRDNALLQPRRAQRTRDCSRRAGRTRCGEVSRPEGSHVLGLPPQRWRARRRPSHRPHPAQAGARSSSTPASTETCAATKSRATMRPSGRSSRSPSRRASRRAEGRQAAPRRRDPAEAERAAGQVQRQARLPITAEPGEPAGEPRADAATPRPADLRS